MTLVGGYWYIKDLKSRNGVKVNGVHVDERRVDPGDVLSIAKHAYEIRYSPNDMGAIGPPPADALDVDVLGRSLLRARRIAEEVGVQGS